MVIIPHHHGVHANVAHQQITDVVGGGHAGQLRSEWLHNEVLDAGLSQQGYFFAGSGEQLQTMVLGVEYHAGMRKKSEHGGFTVHLLGQFHQAVQNAPVTQVYTVKGSCSQDRADNACKLGCLWVGFQSKRHRIRKARSPQI